METVCSFETSGTTFSASECYVPEGVCQFVCLWQSQLTSIGMMILDVAFHVLSYRGDYVSVDTAAFFFTDNIYLVILMCVGPCIIVITEE